MTLNPSTKPADATGARRILMLEERILDIYDQIMILQDKQYCMLHEIEEIRKGEK